MYPADLAYTTEHEWVRVMEEISGTVRIGITEFAQDALGDIAHVTLPPVGTRVVAEEPCGELESTKSVSDLFAPLDGVVTTVNDALDGAPELVNSDPYGDGWLFEVRLDDPAAPAALLDAAAYQNSLGS
ncbi:MULTISPECIES: glycine cleavage system protein GcvH [unclassified Embleya]|uniref:glycine cleavage system protein GcvH n=1 Tax=unclassified Embleya TaxID=2699296 RepID=UPI0034022A08